jgi:hypothetical protein
MNTENLQRFDGDYGSIPFHMQEAIVRYVTDGVLFGDFLRAVVENNLFKAVGHADKQNLALLPLYVMWFYNRSPMGCHGSAERVAEWCKKGGNGQKMTVGTDSNDEFVLLSNLS